MTWYGEELVGFGAAFLGARFGSVGPVGDLVGGDDAQQFGAGALEGARRGQGRPKGLCRESQQGG